MTDSEFINLANDLLRYNGKVNNIMRQQFIRRLRNTPGAVEMARALFGDRGVYNANMKDIGQFVSDTVKITSKGIDKSKYQDYSKLNKK